LSNIFNEAPVLIVEGEDDERIWQQAVRTSRGGIKVYPVPCEGLGEMPELESETRTILESVYERPKAFSLRDRDEGSEEIADMLPIIRMKLSCRAAENLILCDDVLHSLNLTWEQVEARITEWILENTTHGRYGVMKQFADEGYNRKMFDLKELRNLLVGIALDTTKPWEVLVGQVIGRLHRPRNGADLSDHSILAYLGTKVVENLLPV